MWDKLLLSKRAVIETTSHQLKNICQIEHSRYDSGINFLLNIILALIAYSYREKNPSLNLRVKDLADLPVVVI